MIPLPDRRLASDLFQIANEFGVRHHNQKQKQKTNYDERIWLSWMFYYYLANIHKRASSTKVCAGVSWSPGASRGFRCQSPTSFVFVILSCKR